MAKFISIKRLFYGDPFTEEALHEAVTEWLSSATEVGNSHQDTFTYSHDDPETTEYINELKGVPYYIDKTQDGDKTISFTMGEYDYQNKADLMGGSVITDDQGNAIGWKSPTAIEPLKQKGIVALTKTGGVIVFTNASIVAKTDTQEKALGLGVTATAMESGVTGVSDEYTLDSDGITFPD